MTSWNWWQLYTLKLKFGISSKSAMFLNTEFIVKIGTYDERNNQQQATSQFLVSLANGFHFDLMTELETISPCLCFQNVSFCHTQVSFNRSQNRYCQSNRPGFPWTTQRQRFSWRLCKCCVPSVYCGLDFVFFCLTLWLRSGIGSPFYPRVVKIIIDFCL